MTGLSEKGQEIKVCLSLFFKSCTIYTVCTTHSISTSFREGRLAGYSPIVYSPKTST